MDTLSVTAARQEIFHLLDVVNEEHHPVQILGRKNSAILVGKEDWDAVQETLYLLSIPGMRESLISASQEPLSTCHKAKKVRWN